MTYLTTLWKRLNFLIIMVLEICILALDRDSQNNLTLILLAADAYLPGSSIETLHNFPCSTSACAAHCLPAPACNAFNLRLTGGACTCELQSLASRGWQLSDLISEEGSKHWEIKSLHDDSLSYPY